MLGWQFSEAGVLRWSAGRALRFPTVSELFQGGVNAATGALTNGDPGLRPERSWTHDLSADWRWAAGSLRATAFFESTRDALYSQTNTQVVPNVTQVHNVGRISTQGLELAAQAQPLAALSLQGSLSFTDSVIKANPAFPASVGKWQPRVPRWRASLLASYRLASQTTAALGLRHGGKQFNTLDNSDPNGQRYQGAGRLTVLDLRLTQSLSPQWVLAIGVDNLSNRLVWNFHPYPARTYLAELRFQAR